MTLPFLLILILVAYLIGAIPCGVLLTRFFGGGDIRNAGSGNIGATNVYRVAGKKLGILTLLGDLLKGAIPVAFAKFALLLPEWVVAAVAVAAFLGHCYPVYLGFKGGKGVATALGIYLILSPLAVLIAMVLFGGILYKTRYVSLGSIAAATLLPFLVLFINRSHELLAASLLISILVILRHSANIRRLLDGTESRFNA
ncbi:MAG: acyl-phosphate glycerol 3-phosphate acyltransferase [Deltaproteobacteria bacterium HGW-Deltaproteobacteria-4]|nr:MAG: acyl-phosphate glycerol 3-phosphate acyltransferase [Deltaproteobacteria bacterium HGW-Deltaproteobacteria-4]